LLQRSAAGPQINAVNPDDLISWFHTGSRRGRIGLDILHDGTDDRKHTDIACFFAALALGRNREVQLLSVTVNDDRQSAAGTPQNCIRDVLPIRAVFSIERYDLIPRLNAGTIRRRTRFDDVDYRLPDQEFRNVRSVNIEAGDQPDSQYHVHRRAGRG